MNVDRETTWRVPSLQPDEAADLFLDRARSRQYVLIESQRSLIADICERLDNMPLAVELAAARVDTLTVEEIAERTVSFLICQHAQSRVVALAGSGAGSHFERYATGYSWRLRNDLLKPARHFSHTVSRLAERSAAVLRAGRRSGR